PCGESRQGRSRGRAGAARRARAQPDGVARRHPRAPGRPELDGTYRDATLGEVSLHLADRALAIVKDRSREHGVGAGLEALVEMIEDPYAPRSDDLHAYLASYRRGQREIVAEPGAVAVHAGQQDLSGSAALHASRPVQRIETRRGAPTVGEHLPALAPLLGVHGDDDALRTEPLRSLANELRPRHGGRVDRDLVGSGVEQRADVGELAN